MKSGCGRITASCGISGFPKVEPVTAALLFWSFSEKFSAHQAARAAGVASNTAISAFSSLRKITAAYAWRKQEDILRNKLGNIVEIDETSVRSFRIGIEGSCISSDGLRNVLRGPGHVYVRLFGAIERGSRKCVVFELPDVVVPTTETGGAGAPPVISKAEFHGSKLMNYVAPGVKISADSSVFEQ